MRDWYVRLCDYFPEKEMKSKKHFETLFQEKQGFYQLDEGPDHVLVTFEKPEYIFIDYILVDPGARGKGTGSIVLDKLKQKDKAIILEVEPVTIVDPDSEKRIRFYEKNDFLKMDAIGYERIHMVTKELNKMDIFLWSSVYKTEQWAFDTMTDIYHEVHSYKANELYGCHPQPSSEVLWMKELTTINGSNVG